MCKETVDDFIGRTFTTPKGSTLTVVSKIPKVKGVSTKYRIECNVCSKDTELFPDNITSTKGSLERGVIPCGCSKAVMWSKAQYKIRIKRECIKRKMVFKGFYGDWKHKRTKLKLFCEIDGNLWTSTTIDALFQNRGCPKCKANLIGRIKTKPDKFYVTSFMNNNNYPEGTTFSKNLTKKSLNGHCNYWDMYCGVCSEDEYVKAGVCSGVFTATVGHFLEGKLPCRCSKVGRFTLEQRQFKIQSIMESENSGVFDQWFGKYLGSMSRFEWTCPKGHPCRSKVNNYINSGHRCYRCSKSSQDWGFYPERVDEDDYLYLILFYKDGEYFLKIGRSFNPSRRYNEFPNEYTVFPIALFKSRHQVVYDTEQETQDLLEKHAYLPEMTFAGEGECFDLDIIDSDIVKDLFLLSEQDINNVHYIAESVLGGLSNKYS